MFSFKTLTVAAAATAWLLQPAFAADGGDAVAGDEHGVLGSKGDIPYLGLGTWLSSRDKVSLEFDCTVAVC